MRKNTYVSAARATLLVAIAVFASYHFGGEVMATGSCSASCTATSTTSGACISVSCNQAGSGQAGQVCQVATGSCGCDFTAACKGPSAPPPAGGGSN